MAMSKQEVVLRDAYQTVRDVLIDLPSADAIGVLEQVKFERLRDNQTEIDKAAARDRG